MITTSVPANVRRPGRFFEFNVSSAQRGLVALDGDLICAGVLLSGGTASAGEIHEVFSEAEADSLFGTGSELALMLRFALKAFRRFGKAARLYGVGIADPAGTARVLKITVASGTATEARDVVFELSGKTLRAGVSVGDDQDAVALSIRDAIQAASAELPCTAAINGVNANEVDITLRYTGVNGNDLHYAITEGVVAGMGTISAAQTTAGAGTYDITSTLDLLVDRDYNGIALMNHTSTDITDLDTHLDSMWDAGQKFWRFSFVAETGSLATAQSLATAANDYRQHVVNGENFKDLPGEIAAYCAALNIAEDDPAQPFNGRELSDLAKPNAADVPTNAEIESALAGGVTPLSVNSSKTSVVMTRFVTTQTTLNSVPFEALLDTTIPKSMAYVARQVDARWGALFADVKKTPRNVDAVKSETLDVLKAAEALEILQNVDENAAQLTAVTDPVVTSRLNVAIPTSVIPPLNQIVGVMNLIVE